MRSISDRKQLRTPLYRKSNKSARNRKLRGKNEYIKTVRKNGTKCFLVFVCTKRLITFLIDSVKIYKQFLMIYN